MELSSMRIGDESQISDESLRALLLEFKERISLGPKEELERLFTKVEKDWNDRRLNRSLSLTNSWIHAALLSVDTMERRLVTSQHDLENQGNFDEREFFLQSLLTFERFQSQIEVLRMLRSNDVLYDAQTFEARLSDVYHEMNKMMAEVSTLKGNK